MRNATLAAVFVGTLLTTTHARAQEAPEGPTTLAEAFKAARTRSEVVGIRKRELELARADSLSVRSRIMPQAAVTGFGVAQTEVTSNFGGTEFTVNPRTYTAALGLVRQPLFRRGYFDARDANTASIEAARALETRAQEELMLQVAAAYLAVLNGREQLEIAQGAVKRAETQLQVSQARYKAGGALKTVVLLAGVEVERARLRVARAEGASESFAVTFERVVGQRPGDKMEMPASTDDVPTVDDCKKKSRDRSDLRALRKRAEEARKLESAARGELWPRVDAEAGLNYYSFLFPIGDNVLIWNAKLVVTIPLFQGGAEYAKIKQQKIQTNIAELETSLHQRIIESEVFGASANLNASQNAEKIAEDQITVAQEHYNLLSAQFKMGAVTILELSNAQTVLADAERDRALARYESELARFELVTACGGLTL